MRERSPGSRVTTAPARTGFEAPTPVCFAPRSWAKQSDGGPRTHWTTRQREEAPVRLKVCDAAGNRKTRPDVARRRPSEGPPLRHHLDAPCCRSSGLGALPHAFGRPKLWTEGQVASCHRIGRETQARAGPRLDLPYPLGKEFAGSAVGGPGHARARLGAPEVEGPRPRVLSPGIH